MNSIELPVKSDRRRNDLDSFVFTSRVRLTRNVDGLSFPILLNDRDKYRIEEKLVESILKLEPAAVVERIEDMPKDRVMVYLANHVLTREFITHGRVLVHDPAGSWIALLNEDDHLRVFALEYGFNLKPLYERVSALVSSLEESVEFAFDEEKGYLTSSILNVGTGLRLTCVVNLFGLVALKKIESFIETAGKMGFTLQNLHTENADSGLFLLYNLYSLGVSEEEIQNEYRQFLQKVWFLEKEARAAYFENREELEIAREEIYELGRKDRIDYASMLYYISLIDALNKTALEVDDTVGFRGLTVTAHDDTLLYRDQVEPEAVDMVRMDKLRSYVKALRFSQINVRRTNRREP